MSGSVARLNRRFTAAAVGRHLPYRTVRARLTLLYGGLFLLSGAALMAIAYLLLVNAGFIFSLGGSGAPRIGPVVTRPASTHGAGRGLPGAGLRTHPSAQTMAYWRGVARCMRQHGVTSFPNPTNLMPRHAGAFGEISDRDGALLVFGRGVDTQSAAASAAANACGFYADSSQQLAQEDSERAHTRGQLLLQSGIALVAMSLLSLGLGWLLAGRFLQPLETTHTAQRQFVANASHELRAPLARQRALIQVALADPNATLASLREAHERALAAERHLEQIINGLLTLTRGQAGLESREAVDLAAAAAEVISAQQPLLSELGLDLAASLGAARTEGDPLLIERLLANVIGNAIAHNRLAGHVAVATGTRDRAPFVSVTNTGPVVGPEHVERLLRPFERMGRARTGHGAGHGLGLSIVRAIADAHRAELRVLPQPQGGLLVELVFPATHAGSRIPFARAWLRRAAPRATLGD
ncbi:MAG TPA: HAMP domain-containing sensor histidine kinase [Solirubrobacteraceae bacterium]|nr:HAMP domain-containing sensor histidine kinase [Solirubrobacteraceae bacterium]